MSATGNKCSGDTTVQWKARVGEKGAYENVWWFRDMVKVKEKKVQVNVSYRLFPFSLLH